MWMFVDAQTVSLPVEGDADRIVQVLGVLAVDGDHDHVPQVPAPGHVRLGHLLGHPLHLVHDFRREFHRQLIAADDGHDVHSGVVDMAQNLHHPALGALPVIAVVGDVHHHLVAAHGPFGMLLWHEDVLGELVVVRDYESVVFLGPVIGAHDLLHAPGYDSDHLGLLPLPLALRQQCHLHGVLVEGAAGLVLRDVQILFAPLYLHEAEALGMADERPCQGPAVAFDIFRFWGEGQLPLLQELPQDCAEVLPVLFGHLHEGGHLFLFHGDVDGIADQLTDDLLPGVPRFLTHISHILLYPIPAFCR